MKNALLFLMTFTPALLFGQENARVHVLSYNILHGATMKGDFDLDLIAEAIKKTDADLVALQEVDFKTKRAKNMDLATELGYRLKMAPVFGEAMPYDGGSYGEGVLTKMVILAMTNHPLPYTEGHEPRAALEVLVRLSSGDTISFIGTHLDHTRDPANRVAQVKALIEITKRLKYPAILAGDLNATPESEAIQLLTRYWKPSDPKQMPTFPSKGPKVKIDYIMTYPPQRWQVVETKVLDEKVASDHCPYFAVLELVGK